MEARGFEPFPVMLLLAYRLDRKRANPIPLDTPTGTPKCSPLRERASLGKRIKSA
jgi:hypothetical protein